MIEYFSERDIGELTQIKLAGGYRCTERGVAGTRGVLLEADLST